MEKRRNDVGLYFSNLYIHAFHATFHQEHYKGVYLKTDLKTSVHSTGLSLHGITNIRWYNASVYITYTERDTEV